MRLRDAGDRGVLVEVDDLARVHRLATAVRELPGVVDVVPGYRTVLVTVAASPALAEVRSALALLDLPDTSVVPGRLVEVPVDYDGEDLDEVCRLTGLDRDEVVRRHTAPDYLVAFLGFTPGFPYLVGLDPALHVPRRSTPRTAVPPGAVGLAGDQTGVYPSRSPGGWQLIGRTDVVLFDVDRDPPALLAPGDRLRFMGGPVIVVRRAGLLTTVQDLGRPGLAHLGVPAAGAVDAAGLRRANRLVGNPPGAAALEVTAVGPQLLFEVDATVAVHDEALFVPTGRLLDVGPVRRGLRSYVAVRGGIDVPPVLGSRSTCTLSGLGPAPLRDGDRLEVGTSVAGEPRPVEVPVLPGEPVLRVLPGPRAEALRDLGELLDRPWRVGSRSDRTALRLDGAPLSRAASAELASEGLVPGAVQVPPDGRPVLFLAPPTTGGYPVVAVVVTADRWLAAQAAPGTTVRFALSTGDPPSTGR